MTPLSERFPQLKPFNKRQPSKARNIRVGASVNTSRGIGIVTYRKGDKLTVAVRPDRPDELLACYRYSYEVAEVELANEEVDEADRLYMGAWYWIMNSAMHDNQSFESTKHRAIFDEFEPLIPGKRKDREVSAGPWGTFSYRRYAGKNRRGEPFDFELGLTPALAIPYGDRIMYALGIDDGYITDMNGHGWIYRRPIEDSDINYGIAKYAGPQEAEL